MSKLSVTEKKVINTNDIVKQFLKLKEKRELLASKKRELDAKYDAIREHLLDTTRGLGVLTLKTESYTISRRKTTSYKVLDEFKAIDSMKKQGIDPIMRLDRVGNKPSFKVAEIDGVEKTEKEYIAIKDNTK